MGRILLGLSIAPVALILWYVYKKDPDKEPTRQLVKCFAFGLLSLIPVLIFELIFDVFLPTNIESVQSYIQLFFNIFISIGLVEEFFKWLVVKLANYNNSHFDQSYDAIVYCVFASLGFACFENILYVVFQGLSLGVGNAIFTGVLRFLTAVPGHAFYGVIMGFFLTKAKKAQVGKNKTLENKYILLSVMIPSLIHTLYDFLVLSQNLLFILLWLVLIIAINALSIIMIKKASAENERFDFSQSANSNDLNQINYNNVNQTNYNNMNQTNYNNMNQINYNNMNQPNYNNMNQTNYNNMNQTNNNNITNN